MSHALRRDLIFAAPFVVLLGGYAASGGWPDLLRAGLVLAAGVVVVAHIATADEVARARAVTAGGLAFALVALAALAVGVLGAPAMLAYHIEDVWAGLFGVYLACWTALRVAQA